MFIAKEEYIGRNPAGSNVYCKRRIFRQEPSGFQCLQQQKNIQVGTQRVPMFIAKEEYIGRNPSGSNVYSQCLQQKKNIQAGTQRVPMFIAKKKIYRQEPSGFQCLQPMFIAKEEYIGRNPAGSNVYSQCLQQKKNKLKGTQRVRMFITKEEYIGRNPAGSNVYCQCLMNCYSVHSNKFLFLYFILNLF